MLDLVIFMVCWWRFLLVWFIKNDFVECLNGKVFEVNKFKLIYVCVNKIYVYFLILFRFERKKNVIVDYYIILIGFIENEKKIFVILFI